MFYLVHPNAFSSSSFLFHDNQESCCLLTRSTDLWVCMFDLENKVLKDNYVNLFDLG